MYTVKVLVNDSLHRYKRGDVGIVLINDFYKYDYCIYFGMEEKKIDFIFGDRLYLLPKTIYFYKNEVEIIE